MTERTSHSTAEARGARASRSAAAAGIACDFCGEVVPTVRRVAVDVGYERLQTPHRELYACPPCSERKEKARRGDR
jgi:hypothetical protein